VWPRNLASRYRKRPRKQTHRNRVISFREWLSYAERYLLEVENVITVSSNGLVACEVAELKVRSLMKVPKVVRTYLLEPLHKAAIAQLPRVSTSL
jgi:hypothetical protein